jgi:hypothetical protein
MYRQFNNEVKVVFHFVLPWFFGETGLFLYLWNSCRVMYYPSSSVALMKLSEVLMKTLGLFVRAARAYGPVRPVACTRWCMGRVVL